MSKLQSDIGYQWFVASEVITMNYCRRQYY